MKLELAHARRVLLAAVGPVASAAATPDALLARLRHIQLDPLDRIGTNADLVALARSDLRRGAIHTAVSFEHVAKEQCLLPAYAFPYYREEALRRPTWRFTKAMREVPTSVCDAVVAEVAERGPLISRELSDHGRIERNDQGGWASSGKLGTLALRVLTSQCRLVVCGRRGKESVFDLPSRALPEVWDRTPTAPFERWALHERAAAAGLLSLHQGPWWGALEQVRRGPHPGLQQVDVAGRPYLVHPALLDAAVEEDDRLRILGPLDPLLWNRTLVEALFDFTYLWEVYKPAATRRWGYYVCPLLYRGALVGRIEAHVEHGAVVLDRVWWEAEPYDTALEAALARHGEQLC